ncbi:MAG: hypothetical protein NTY77_00585 [Elusimicrobia bacterium]|nr:hypothetical protein [Elusimicrobiota bacterium]
MLRHISRLTRSSVCVACLGAVAAALFWPAQDIPRLGPVIAAQTPDSASSAEGPTAAASAPPGRTEPSDEAEDPTSDEASDEARTRSDPAGEPVRDAVADGPWRAAPAGGELIQAPWRAYWGVTKRETAAVPVAQDLPATYRRVSKDGGPRASAPLKQADAFPNGRSLRAAGPAGQVFRPQENAAQTFSPDKLSRRMADLLRRIRAARASAPALTGAPRASSRQSRHALSDSTRRAALPRADLRAKGAHKLKAGPKPKAKPKAKIARKTMSIKPPRLRPVLLSKVLGINAIRPPKTAGQAPDFSRLARDTPRTGPDGRPVIQSPAEATALEDVRPPAGAAADCRKIGPHWHSGPEPAYHEGTAWGLQHDGGWLWLKKSGKNWWAWTAPDEPTWLWHAERWWWRSDDVWFMLHEGEVWGYRLFGERRAEGLIHPGTGTHMEYSADGKRVAMITPGDGAWLFDARSGTVLGRWSEAQMPAKAKPHAPRSLSLPP